MRNRFFQTLATTALAVSACQASPEATSAASTPSATPFKTREIAAFSSPWAMAFLPGRGNWALLTEKEGKLWMVDADTGQRMAVTGFPAPHVAGQGGLGDVVPHPDFARNGRVYLTWVEAGDGGTSGAAMGYGTLVNTGGKLSLKDFRTIWRQQSKVSGDGHFSHRMAFGPDGFLYLTSGERQKFDPAQDLTVNLGKVLRLTAEGQPAPGNPFAARGGVAAQIYSYGHRNLLGLAFDDQGRLWENEMGPKGGDEVNLIAAGQNYGWPRASNGSHYDGKDIPDHKPGDGFTPPKVWWNPSISPSSLLIYRGDKFPQWKGDALIGALSGEALIRVDLDGANAAKADQWPMGARIRAVDEGPDGSVYVLEDEGRLMRLDPVAPAA
jgi:glucose/arabinose dehydrogenase